MIEVIWSEFKTMISSNMKWVHTYEGQDCIVIGSFGAMNIKCFLRNGSIELADFETNYRPNPSKLQEVDEQGRQILRVAAGQSGWTYLAHPIEFETSKIGSLYEKLASGVDRGVSSVKFFDVNDVEVTDPLNETSIVKTVMLFKPSYDYELISGDLQQIEAPNSDLRVWVVGGIIELGGAYVKEFAGGLNMRFYGANESVRTDGRAAKYMKKDIAGVPYQANQLQVIIKHDAGVKHKLKLVLEYFRA